MTSRWSSTGALCIAVTLVLGWTTAPLWSSQSAAAQAGDPAAALFKAADAVRVAGRTDEAISKYQRIMADRRTP